MATKPKTPKPKQAKSKRKADSLTEANVNAVFNGATEAHPEFQHITKDLRQFAVRAETLHFDSFNARKHSRENLDAIKRSLEQFGQLKPLVVQRKGMVVVAGNGTLQAARELGWVYVAAVIVDQDNQQATAFGIADNRTAELAQWDGPMLFTLLHELEKEAPALLEAVSFSDKEFDRLKARYGDPDETTQNNPNNTDPKDNTPKVGIKAITLNYAKPDHDVVKEAMDYLKDQYGTTSNEDTVRRCLTDAAANHRQDLLEGMD